MDIQRAVVDTGKVRLACRPPQQSGNQARLAEFKARYRGRKAPQLSLWKVGK